MNAKTSHKMPSQDSSSGREKKKGGGFLMRAAKSKKEDVTEDQLLKKDVITPQDIVRLDKITESELCYCFVLHITIGLRLQSAIGNSSRVLHSRDLFLLKPTAIKMDDSLCYLAFLLI